ncbi:Monomeric sarcosine oxidase [Serratia quinivorans]|uniref:NAD(P)/FAD-dependent oxidoreductase n=2 Tax=Serratia TaxID=613 RepID=A0ABV3UK07_9GAMM|nr:FAD-binding oxidoreductase [Serratia quinivorans]CAI1624926.1 Monomeric sarcosine oxidase [Serratia quinivorans]CAI1635315.1 Monomeric sarcosine oxidase [Serratia quinivorans]CAI1788539.1 Monomeric sarcosine oxidase [Serratia quinivorans]
MCTTEKHMIVIGAGIMGASIAYHLASRGIKVTVIDKDQPSSGATGSSFGWIHTTVSDDAPDAFLRRASVADWKRLEKEIPELWVNWTGALSYDDESLKSQPEENLLQQPEISQLEPAFNNPPQRAYYAVYDGAVDPIDATHALLEKACSLGVTLKSQTPVIGFLRNGNRVSGIQTPEGVLNADSVILACGTGITPLLATLGIPLPILASPAILLRFGTEKHLINTLISGHDVEARHARNGDILAAEDFPLSGNTDNVATETLAAIKTGLNGAASLHLRSQSVGQRPVPKDGCPVIGFIDEVPGVYVAVMHPAVTCAATLGRMVSEELISGNNPEIPAIYHPGRLISDAKQP